MKCWSFKPYSSNFFGKPINRCSLASPSAVTEVARVLEFFNNKFKITIFYRSFFQSLGNTIRENAKLLTVAILAIAESGLPAILSALGFGPLGPTAGSIAAAWQSSIGNVASGSLFALLQTISMTSPGIEIPIGIGLAGAVFIVVNYIINNELEKNEELRKFVEEEKNKILRAMEGMMAYTGQKVGQLINSPAVQDSYQWAMGFAARNRARINSEFIRAVAQRLTSPCRRHITSNIAVFQ